MIPLTIPDVARQLGMTYWRCRHRLMKLRKSDERGGKPVDWIEKEQQIPHLDGEASIDHARWMVNLPRLERAHPSFFRPREVVGRDDLDALHETLGGLRRDVNRLASTIRDLRNRVVAMERGSSERSECEAGVR